jgi:hypothetical protein
MFTASVELERGAMLLQVEAHDPGTFESSSGQQREGDAHEVAPFSRAQHEHRPPTSIAAAFASRSMRTIERRGRGARRPSCTGSSARGGSCRCGLVHADGIVRSFSPAFAREESVV